jgi:hypothetical protein
MKGNEKIIIKEIKYEEWIQMNVNLIQKIMLLFMQNSYFYFHSRIKIFIHVFLLVN